MTTSGNHGLQGPELGPDVLDRVEELRRWLNDNPGHRQEPEVRRQLQELLTPSEGKAITLPDWTWPEAEAPNPREWLVRDWLPAGRVALLAGRGGAGKSRLALQLAAGIASGGGDGDAWIDAPEDTLRLGQAIPSTGAPVVYASWEDEEDEFARRLSQMSGSATPWITPDRLGDLHVINLARLGSLWAPIQGRHISTLAELTEVGQLLRRKVEELGARMLIVDPLAAAYAGDENSRGLVRAFVADWDGWGQDFGCAMLIVAHPPKSGADYAGSTDWEGAVRSMWTMREEPWGARPEANGNGRSRVDDTRPLAWRLDLPKRNYSPPQAPLKLEWDSTGGGLRWKANWWDTSNNQVVNGVGEAGYDPAT